MNTFYVAFLHEFMTERGKLLVREHEGEFDYQYNWFEFPSEAQAHRFVYALNEGRNYCKLDFGIARVTQYGTYSEDLFYETPPFEGTKAGEIFTLVD